VVAAAYLVVPLVRLHFPERVDVSDRVLRQQKPCVAVIIYSITFFLLDISNWCSYECHTLTPDKKREFREMVDEAIEGKINANRRFVDDVLEKIQDRNRQYFLEKLGTELRQAELEQKAGNMQGAMHHRVMADVYKSIIEKCFC
jgi:hypothetical protein